MRTRRPAPPTARRQVFGPLSNPFAPYEPFSADYIAHLHAASLALLKDQGLRVLLDEARDVYAQAGARIEDDQVFLDADLVAAALEPWRIFVSWFN